MQRRKYDVFISYRRKGGMETAKHLNDLLVRDGYRVSFDIDTLRSGLFDTQLYSRIDQCHDFILIVDPHAFDRTLDQSVKPEEDWLRSELAYALRKGKNVVPVFLDGVSGFPANLPEDVASVTKMNGPRFDLYFFDEFYRILKRRFLHRSRRALYLNVLAGTLLIAGILSFLLLTRSHLSTIDYAPSAVVDEPREDTRAKDSVEIFEHYMRWQKEAEALRNSQPEPAKQEPKQTEQEPKQREDDIYGVPPAPKFKEARFETFPVDFEDTSLGYWKAEDSPMVGYIISVDDSDTRVIEVIVQNAETRVRSKFYVDNDMSNVDKSWLPYVLIPGNKVKIEYYYSGNGGYQFVSSMENLRR